MAKLERTDKSVSILIDELSKNELGIPEVQRGYEWNRPQVRDLLDSLYREYPSGLILLWKPGKLPKLRKPAIDQVGKDKTPNFLILDGQQRITSLSKIKNGDINVYFNVENESFQMYSRRLGANPLWVSTKEVINRGAVRVWRELKSNLFSLSGNVTDEKLDQYLDRLSRLERIKDYRYPVMILHTDDYEEVTESFIRINRKGTRLKLAELAMAKLAFNWPGVIIKEFESALEKYEQVNFDFEARFLMRCFVAVGTGQSRFRYLGGLWKRSKGELRGIWEKTIKGLDHTINFLKNNAGIESSEWIPSQNALVPLVVYFSMKKEPITDRENRSLLFWLFNATVHARFSGSPETKIDQDLKGILDPKPVEALLNILKRDIQSFTIKPVMIEGRYQRHSFLPLMFAVFRKSNSEDWWTGTLLSSTNVGSSHQLQFHHVFPRAVLRKTGLYTRYEIDDLCNIAFVSERANKSILSSKPSEYLPRIEEERLKAQFIPVDRSLWEVERFKDFLQNRRETLAREMNQYISNLSRQELVERPHAKEYMRIA